MEPKQEWTEKLPKNCPECGERLALRDQRGGYCKTHYWIVPSLPQRLRLRITALEQERDELRRAARNYAHDACYECGTGSCNKPFHAALLAALSPSQGRTQAEEGKE